MNTRQLIELLRTRRSSTARGACPDELSLAAMVDAAIDDAERHELELHLADCSRCLSKIAFLVRTRDLAPAAVPEELVERASHRPRPTRVNYRGWAAAAAVLVAALALWTVVRQPDDESRMSSPPRARAVEDATAGPVLVLPREGEALSRAAPRFAWSAVDDALFYGVRVLAADGEVLWDTRTEGLDIAAPPSLILNAGETYYFRVSAFLAGGRTIDSRHRAFEVIDP